MRIINIVFSFIAYVCECFPKAIFHCWQQTSPFKHWQFSCLKQNFAHFHVSEHSTSSSLESLFGSKCPFSGLSFCTLVKKLK